MIAVKCTEHLRAVERFADSIGQRDALQEALHYLGTYANGPGCVHEHDGTRCELFRDFAPY